MSNALLANGKFARAIPALFADDLVRGVGRLSIRSKAFIAAADYLVGINTIEGAA